MRRSVLLCARATPLSRHALTLALHDTPGWHTDNNNDNMICRDFAFHDFRQAMTFMNAAAAECEAMGHHPCWTNTYNKLHVELTTHDAGNRVTQKDIDLARRMNEVFRGIIDR
ncbi:pterin-4-alpha-carbinolamine dehydratase [Trypanosoma grayi]|uniref:pterin-4-alpha-carbinolamine dehydratase n=1 Tax=Trypanosoma grayi TaxID=71804 RepID=UPI0004F41068|nr:pterin-4-alpha-carbinolamine dehydratase [Trypanosoma grayi]KEG09288.1 pterin-4-alpha-carbinolamine dehydratase [Trypanosoma grayi]